MVLLAHIVLTVYMRWDPVKKPMKCLSHTLSNVCGFSAQTTNNVMVFATIHPPLLKAHTNYTVVKWHHSLLPLILLLSGLPGSDQDREDLQGRLRLAETRAEELAESLRAATSSMEQYRAMAQSLEESLDKEKQVQNKPKLSVSIPRLT